MKRLWLMVGLLVVVAALYHRFGSDTDMTQTPVPDIPYVDFDYYAARLPKNVLAVMLHGGSWQVGDKLQLETVGRYLANQGVSVVNMNYRKTPLFTFDAPLRDIAAVINEVEKDLPAFGLSKDYRLMLLGFSAGGHLAAQFCVTEADYGVRDVDICVGLAGIYDLKRVMNGDDGPLLVDSVQAFLGATESVFASPQYRVSAKESTHFLLFWGEDDAVVARGQMEGFAARLSELGVTVSATEVSGKDHLSIFDSIATSDEIGKAIVQAI